TELHRGGRRTIGRPPPRLPRIQLLLAASTPRARSRGLPRSRTRHARLRTVAEAARRRRVSDDGDRRRHPRADRATRRRAVHPRRPRLGRVRRVVLRDVASGAAAQARDPQRPASRAALARTAPLLPPETEADLSARVSHPEAPRAADAD